MPTPNTDQYDAEWNRLLRENGLADNESTAETSRLNNQDSFAHDPNNIVANGKDYKFEFTPNILDNYDQYTYHWKLFMTSLENARSGAVIETRNQVVIAESGVTDITIDKVQLETVASPNAISGTGTMTTVKFELIEPSGAGLIDRMFYQSVGLGVGNWMVQPFFLQLDFKGRSPSTSQTNETGNPPGMEGKKWIWKIQINEMKAHVDHVGTRYEASGTIYDERAQTDMYNNIQQRVTLSGITTFGDAMQQLENNLNANQYEQLVENAEVPDTYRIVVDPVLAKIDVSTANDNLSTKFSSEFSNFVDFGKKTAQYNAGTGIDKIIDSLLINTDHVQITMQQSSTPGSTPKPITEVSDQMKKLWRIITETRPLAYDRLRQQPAVEIVIYVVEYDIGVVDVTAAQTGQTSSDITASKLRMAEYAQKKILNKKYNYIFTGLNDQIIKFDLDMNFSFVATQARFDGAYYDSFTTTPGIAVKKNLIEEQQRVKKIVRDTINFIHNSPDDASVFKKLEYAQSAITSSSLDPETEQRYINLLNNARAGDRKKFVQETQQKAIDNARRYAKFLAEPTSLSNSHGDAIGTTTFLSDVNINSQVAKEAHATFMSLGAAKLHPVAFSEGFQEAAVTFGIDPSKTAGRARVSSIFATALYTTGVDGSMTAIKLTLKGDPYWLFPRGVDPTAKTLNYKSLMADDVAINYIKNNSDRSSVNLYSSDNFIVIRFRTPRIFSGDTNVDNLYTEVETFSGVFKVITISNRFDMGKFTQELNCFLDPVINLVDFLGELDQANRTPDTVIVEGVTLPIPSTSLKTPSRIATTGVGETGVAYVTTSEFIINTMKRELGDGSNIPPQAEDDEA